MDAIIGVNRWYDGLPETRRMLVVPAVLIVVGTINMAMTIGNGFPFGLLFLIVLLAILALRAPYVWGYVRDPAGHATAAADHGLPDLTPHLQIDAPWLYDANLRYNALPETRRMMVIPLFLAVVGAINMSLTISSGFPFGLLFLFGVIAVVGLRLPFEAGWVKQPGAAAPVAVASPELAAPTPPEPALLVGDAVQPVAAHAPAADAMSEPAVLPPHETPPAAPVPPVTPSAGAPIAD